MIGKITLSSPTHSNAQRTIILDDLSPRAAKSLPFDVV